MAAPQELPPLRHITIAEVSRMKTLPSLKIRTDEDVEIWRTTQGYQDYGLFLRRLNESVVGHFLPWISLVQSQATTSMLSMLDTLDSWINEIPPLPTPQRFGNLAFRTWGKRLESEVQTLLSSLLPTELHVVIPQLSPYFLTSFGSFTRMDYGSGHETSFALFLLCLTLIRFFEPIPEQERDLVLIVFMRYLRLCWKLQDVYNLEPAGSHGVWGLDDYSFLGYIFGSAQLRDQTEIPVSAILHRPLPPTNLYFLSINRINEVKFGPFHEHSSQLYSIATGVQRWAKVNSGLFKMYEAEVLGKRVVVQHIPLGGLLKWDVASYPPPSQSTPHIPTDGAAHSTAAPWAMPTTIPSTDLSAFPTYTTGTSRELHTPTIRPGQSFGTHHPQRHGGPIVPAQMPLGPLASTTLHPMKLGGTPTSTDSKTKPDDLHTTSRTNR